MSNNDIGYKPDEKMRNIVKDHNSVILVMGRFGLPLGFGNKSVSEVCHTHNVDEITFLEVVNFVVNGICNYDNISLHSLMGYLKQAHEYFLEFNLPNIRRKLIEAIDCSNNNDIAILIIRFYDEYVAEVKKHMEYENQFVFTYVEQLLEGILNRNYSISEFAGNHTPIGYKLKELKDIIIRYYPEKNNYLLNATLLDILLCEQDLTSHCEIEDKLFVPAVKLVEKQLLRSGKIVYADNVHNKSESNEKVEELTNREKDILICLAKGMSYKEIADELCISVNTVTTHRRNISNKLQIHSSVGLVIYAIANKMVNIADIN